MTLAVTVIRAKIAHIRGEWSAVARYEYRYISQVDGGNALRYAGPPDPQITSDSLGVWGPL